MPANTNFMMNDFPCPSASANAAREDALAKKVGRQLQTTKPKGAIQKTHPTNAIQKSSATDQKMPLRH
jgi:hypothetical protein